MRCPICNVDLKISDRQGVEIDYCPQCRGVWLDRGELDKIIERSNAYNESESRSSYRGDSRYDDDDRGYDSHKKKKKGSFLGELFDF